MNKPLSHHINHRW